MTVTVSYSPLTYNCNGSTTAFSVTWPFFLSSDLVVTHITSAGVETVLTLTTDYTVTGGRDSTTGLPAVGTVTTVATYASGVKIRISRATPRTQSTSFTTASAFAAKTLEATIDRLHMIAEEGAGGSPAQDVDGSSLRLETSGATDYWDGEGYIARGFDDGVEDTDLVTKSQLDAVSDQITSPTGDVIDFSTRASAIDTDIGASIGAIRTRGYTSAGDGGGALYKRAGSEPSHSGKFQSADGAWWEIAETCVNVLAFGAKGDNSNDDATAIQNAITYIESLTTPTEGPNGKVVAPAGRLYKIASGLTFSKPSIFHCYGFLNYTPTTGRAVTVNSTAPSAGRNTGFDIWIAGIRAVNGNSSQPASVNASGCTGLEIRNMQFSRVYVGKVIAFTKHGVYFNCSGDSYSGQHIQDNEFTLGEIAYNGVGIKLLSDDAATGAFQANHVKLQNAFTNYYNLEIDDASNDDSSDNIWDITAIDAPASGGTCVRMLSGNYNHFRIGYMDGTLSLAATTNDNYFWIGNDTTTGLTISDSGENWIETAGGGGGRRIYSPKYTYDNGVMVLTTSLTAPAFFIDTNGFLSLSGGTTPTWQWDTNDYMYYDRTGNTANITIGGVVQWSLSATGLTLTGFSQASEFRVSGTKVVGARATGYTNTATGTLSRSTALDGSWTQSISGTYSQAEVTALRDQIIVLTQRLAALETDLRTHGLIGA